MKKILEVKGIQKLKKSVAFILENNKVVSVSDEDFYNISESGIEKVVVGSDNTRYKTLLEYTTIDDESFYQIVAFEKIVNAIELVIDKTYADKDWNTLTLIGIDEENNRYTFYENRNSRTVTYTYDEILDLQIG